MTVFPSSPLKTFVASGVHDGPKEFWTLDIDSNMEQMKGDGKDNSFVLTTTCGNMTVTISDSIQIPVLVAILKSNAISMRGDQLKSELGYTFEFSLSSFNSKLLSGEPVIEKTGAIVKASVISNEFSSSSLPRELHVKFMLTSQLHTTVSYAAIESIIYLLSEWNSMAKGGSLYVNRSSHSMNTVLTNRTGSTFFLLLIFEDGTQKIHEVGPTQIPFQIDQPFRSPYCLKSTAVNRDDGHLKVRIGDIKGSIRRGQMLLYTVNVTLEQKDKKVSSYTTTRFFSGFDDGKFQCDEVLLVPILLSTREYLTNYSGNENEFPTVCINLLESRDVDMKGSRIIASISYPLLLDSDHNVAGRDDICKVDYPMESAHITSLTTNEVTMSFSISLPNFEEPVADKTDMSTSQAGRYIGVSFRSYSRKCALAVGALHQDLPCP